MHIYISRKEEACFVDMIMNLALTPLTYLSGPHSWTAQLPHVLTVSSHMTTHHCVLLPYSFLWNHTNFLTLYKVVYVF